MKKVILIALIAFFALIHVERINTFAAATRLFPYQGGTGTSTVPALGSVLVGRNSSEYCVLGVGTNGQVFEASSTAACGASWETDNSGVGTVTTSSAITVDHVPRWVTAEGGLAGTSSIIQAGAAGNVRILVNTGIGAAPEARFDVRAGGTTVGDLIYWGNVSNGLFGYIGTGVSSNYIRGSTAASLILGADNGTSITLNTNDTVTIATTTFFAGNANVTGTFSVSGDVTTRASSTMSSYATCNLETDGTGLVICGVDDSGGGGTESGWRTNNPFVYLTTSTSLVGVGATSTNVKFYIQNTGGGVASTTAYIQGIAGQTGSLLTFASSSGSSFLEIDDNGQILATTTDSATVPSYSFLGDTDTGIFNTFADNVGITTAGVSRWDIDVTDMLYSVPARGPSGTAALPAYAASIDIDTGIFFGSDGTANTLGFSTAGIERARFSTADFGIGTTQPSSTVHIIATNSPTSTFRVSSPTGLTVFDVNGTSTTNNILEVQSSSSVIYFGVASSGVPLALGTSSISIGGSSLAAGACTSTNVTFPLRLSTTTDEVEATPQVYPGDSAYWKAHIITTGPTSSVRVLVCEAVLGTPTASQYNVLIRRMTGL